MKAQFENKIISSFLLWFDHTLLKKGEAFTNFGSNLFDVPTSFYGYETYGAPFKQFVADSSIAGANIINGLHLTGTFVPVGEDGLIDINYGDGQVYIDHVIPQNQTSNSNGTFISGDYAVKDFNIYLTNKVEQDLLFETKVELRPKTSQTVTGLAPNTIAYPAVFIKNNGGENEPFSFGGQDKTNNNIRAIVLADSSFSLDAVCSIFKDTTRNSFKLVAESDYPFNAFGGLKGGSSYNYNNLPSTSSEDVYIKEVDIVKFDVGYMSNMTNANPDVFSAMIDFELNSFRYPRL